jgi:Amt family ammonium transporter
VLGIVCNFATKGKYTSALFPPPATTTTTTRLTTFPCLVVKYWIRINDAMDVFAEHAVSGMVGLLANALFGADYIVGLDGVTTGATNPTTGTGIGRWVTHNYRQFYIQLAYVVAVTAYLFVVSAILAYAVNAIPGLHLRVLTEAELIGMDDDHLGEFAHDYVEVQRDYLAWARSGDEQKGVGEEIPMHKRYGIGEHKDMLAEPGKSTGGSSRKGVAQGDRHAVKAEDEKKVEVDTKKGI